MEFFLEKTGGQYYVILDTGDGAVSREVITPQALLDREELLKYCTRRLHAVYDEKARAKKPLVYSGIDNDLSKVFEISADFVVEKSSRK